MSWRFSKIAVTAVCSLALLMAQCSGSSSGTSDTGDVEGLSVANQVSLLASDGTSLGSSLLALAESTAPTSGDYTDDEPEIYTYDRSMDVLDTINEILCSIDQTQYEELLNQGDYIALINTTQCRKDRSDGQNDQSSGSSDEFEIWKVNSSRADNDSPQIVTFWIESEGGADEDGFAEIRAEMTITEGKSETNPFGLFSLNFTGFADDGVTLAMHGNLSTLANEDGLVELAMTMEEGNGEMQTHALIAPDGSAGQAFAHKVASEDGFDFEQSIRIAFDDAHYLADYGDESECLDKQNFDKSVWSYNLYDADGNRVERNSGTSIKAGEHEYGWAGYYGIWLPDSVDLETGLALTSGDGDTPYTVFVGEGRLIRRTLEEHTMADFIGNTFSYWDSQTFENFQVEFDGTTLVKVGSYSCDEQGCQFAELETPEPVTLEAGMYVGLWADGLGNLDIIVPESGSIDADTSVTVHVQEFVQPEDALLADGALSFKCYNYCPRAGLTAEDLASGDIYYDSTFDVNSPYVYEFDPETYALSFEGEPVVYPAGAEDVGGNYSWGFQASMVLADVALDDVWSIYNADESFSFEIGPNSWNKYTALLDADGQTIDFEAPLRCNYHNEDYGTYILDYQGEGQLHGLPYECVQDEEHGFMRCDSLFVIDDGSEVTCDGETYFTKAMRIEQKMQSVDLADCSDLDVGDISAPEDIFEDPELPEAPEVTDAPKVIGGVVQE